MRSPFADCDAHIYKEQRIGNVRGEDFTYLFVGYKCDMTGEIFTTMEQEDANLNQVYNQYRDAHNIPYTQEIHNLRKAYGISASKMAQILGWGGNQYRLYENGDIPSVNNGKQLRAIQNPSIFCAYVDMSQLPDTEKSAIKTKAMNSRYAMSDTERFIRSLIFGCAQGRYDGYTAQSLSKLKNVMLFFIGKIGNVFQTKMNKLLFYADFLSYKRYGHGITGLAYIAHRFGPVPQNWDKVFSLTEDIKKDVINCGNGNEGFVLTSDISYDANEFTDEELSVLNDVAGRFSSCSPSQISDISHKEDAWKDNIEGHKLIDYSYAFSLKAV